MEKIYTSSRSLRFVNFGAQATSTLHMMQLYTCILSCCELLKLYYDYNHPLLWIAKIFFGWIIMDIHFSNLWSSYDVIVDVAPEIKWVPEDGYKNLKVVVEIDSEIDAQSASEQELKRRHKSLGSLRIVTDRGLQVKAGFSTIDGYIF